MGGPTDVLDTVELVGGPLCGELQITYARTPAIVFPTFRGGVAADGTLQVGQLVYADTGRRTADGRRVFAPGA